eukprot:TRINITY_DN4036_c0_g1_i2.p1 TRINITY_DN4036_c0_g1~~TRINITY_DN4036_c0_g1_i2.p1  ORF type:complete len:639 (+),score=134.46 TRINITY_DN4036_c0_g1_i2:38-1954(+)
MVVSAAVSSTPHFGRAGQCDDITGEGPQAPGMSAVGGRATAGPDEGGGMPPMTGRSLQDAFSQMLTAEDGSDAAAGPRDRRTLSQPPSYSPSQSSQAAPSSPQRQHEPLTAAWQHCKPGLGGGTIHTAETSTASSSKQAFSSPWKASRQPAVQQGRQHPMKDSGGGSQSSRSLRGSASATAVVSSQGRCSEDGRDARRRAVVTVSSAGGGAASVERRRRSAKRTEEVAAGAGRTSAGAPSSGGGAEAPEVRQLKQEVYAKDQEILKLRAMCQEQASRLKNYEAYNSLEMEALKQRMEEFEHQLKAQGGTVGVPVSSGQSSWPPPAPFATGLGSGAGGESVQSTVLEPSAARNDSVGSPLEAATREGTTPRQAPAASAGALHDESPADWQTSSSMTMPVHSACSASLSPDLPYAGQRSRSSEAPEVRPQWAAPAAERPSPELLVASPRQAAHGSAGPKAAWQTMFSPRNSLRSANAAHSAPAVEPAGTLYRAASMSQMAPAVRTSLAACGSSRASLGSVTTVRKVAQAMAPPPASGSRSRSPSGGPATPCGSSNGHPVVLPFCPGMADAMQQYHRSSRATLPAAVVSGRPVTTWQMQDNQSGIATLTGRSLPSSAATQQQQQPQFAAGPTGHCAAFSRR